MLAGNGDAGQNLHAVVDDGEGGVGAVVLAHSGRTRVELAVVVVGIPSGFVEHVLHVLQLDGHLGDLELVELLAADRLTVGRSPQCDIFLNDMTVSRMHATIERTPAGFRISDADSFNGLWVNNLNVKDADLRDGDIVQIGTFCLMYLATPTMR